MSRDLTGAHSAAYGGENVREIIFVEMDFTSGFVRAHNAVGTITWGGYDWNGVGKLGGVSILEEGVEIRPLRVKLTLSGIDSSLVSTAITEEYHGRSVKIYRGTTDADYALNADPDLIWSGFMDHMTVSLSQGTGMIELVCENILARYDTPKPQRFTNADQQARSAGDLFFEYLPQLAEYEVEWGGKVVRPWGPTTGPLTTHGQDHNQSRWQPP